MSPTLALLLLLCIPVMVFDLTARRIPNVLLLVVSMLAAVWLVGKLWLPSGLAPGVADVLWRHGLGALLGCLVLLPFWWWGVMGAGDVKLFAVIGWVCGYNVLFPVWWLASLAAGCHGLAMLLWRRPFARAWRENVAQRLWARRLHAWRDGREGIPYGAYLAAAALLVR